MKISKILTAGLFAVSLGAFAQTANAAPVELITNGTFEGGSLAGWTAANSSGYGGFFVIGNGANVGISGHPTQALGGGGSFVAAGSQNGAGAEVLLQTFTVLAGTGSLTLNFDYFNNTHAGYSGSSLTSGQSSRVDILSSSAGLYDTGAGVVQSLLLNAGAFTNFGTTIPWSHYSFDLSGLAAGTYQLRFGQYECCFYQETGVDNVSLLADAAGVPAPGALALLGFGLFGLAGLRRKAKAA